MQNQIKSAIRDPNLRLLVDGVPFAILECFKHCFAHRWVCMNCVDHVIESCLEFDGDDAFMNHVGNVGSNHMHAEDLAVLLVAHDLYESILLGSCHRFAERAEIEFPDENLMALGLCFTLRHAH